MMGADPLRSGTRATTDYVLRTARRIGAAEIPKICEGIYHFDSVQADRLTMPVLVMVGATDGSAFQAQAEDFCRCLPRASMVRIDRAGHTILYDAPAATAAALDRFARNHMSPHAGECAPGTSDAP